MTSIAVSNTSKDDFFSASEDSWDDMSDTSSNATTKSTKPAAGENTGKDDGVLWRPSYHRRTKEYGLQPGIYVIENDQNRDMVIDLAGYDFITILAYSKHGGDNQKWEFERLGPGYSIKSVLKGTYITLQTGAIEGGSLVASPFPVSWELEADEYESGLWKIRWPRSNFVFDLPNIRRNDVSLRGSYPFKPTRLWRLVDVTPPHPNEDNILQVTASSPKKLKLEGKPTVVTTADTIVDVEGLKLGGNGEMSITTTTTTVTTSVTTVKRLGGASS